MVCELCTWQSERCSRSAWRFISSISTPGTLQLPILLFGRGRGSDKQLRDKPYLSDDLRISIAEVYNNSANAETDQYRDVGRGDIG